MSRILDGVFKMFIGLLPRNKPKAGFMRFDFEADGAVIAVDLMTDEQMAVLEFVQSVYFDNSDNDSEVRMMIMPHQQRLVFPANSTGYLPVLSDQVTQFTLTCADADGVLRMNFLNMPVGPIINGPVAIAGGGGGILPVNPIQRADMVNHSGATGTGVSTEIMPANPDRLDLIIQNPMNNAQSIWINFGAPAQADSTSYEITPGGFYRGASGIVTTQAINVFSVTDQLFYAAEQSA